MRNATRFAIGITTIWVAFATAQTGRERADSFQLPVQAWSTYPQTPALRLEAPDASVMPSFQVPISQPVVDPNTSKAAPAASVPADANLPSFRIPVNRSSQPMLPTPDATTGIPPKAAHGNFHFEPFKVERGPTSLNPEDVNLSEVAPPSMRRGGLNLVSPPADGMFRLDDSMTRNARSPRKPERIAQAPIDELESSVFPVTEAPPIQAVQPLAESTKAEPNQAVSRHSDPAADEFNQQPGVEYHDQVFEMGDCGFAEHFGPPFDERAFCPDPRYPDGYDPNLEMQVYEGKWNQCSQRPLIELGRGIYRNGPVPESYSFLGKKNLITPGFNVFGDYRNAVAANDNGVGDFQGIWAHRLNLDFDLRLTATERIHAFWGPLDQGNNFSRAVFSTDGQDNLELFQEFDDDFDTFFFEGDLGYIYGGMTDQYAPFDLPFVIGKFPLLFANGVWINDAIEGAAFTIPARNSALLDWSNFEFTFFAGIDDVDSAAFNNDNDADLYGFNSFVEAYGGYTEFGYAYLDDRSGQGLSYHNLTFSHTRRFFERISNSVRVILNMGQDPLDGPQTADGQLLLIENALVSSNPTYYVPYFNMFFGFDRPRALAGLAGPLLNTGINFETDALTGFPRLTDTGVDSWGGAFGFNLLGPRFRWQWILEAAMIQSFGESPNGDEYAVGSRFQLPINYAWLVRFDAMYGLRENAADISGVRAELRWKF